MKKHSVLSAVLYCFLFIVPVSAHVNVNLGITGGLDFYREKSTERKPFNAYGSKPGFVAGVVFEVSLSKYISIEPRLLFTNRGAFSSGVDSGYPYKYQDKLGYINLPIQIKLKYPVTNIINIYTLGDLNPGILFYAKSHTEKMNLYFNEVHDINIIDKMNKFDFGIDFGIGFESMLLKSLPFIEAVYYWGLIQIFKSENYDNQNNGFEIKGGIKFKI
jgi:hypothetical protein